MGLRAPRHRIDARPVFICPDDDAWDHERIKAERAEDLEAQRKEKHPVDVYQEGETRYDLGAEIPYRGGAVKIGEYVDLAQAWQFIGKRLTQPMVYAVDDLVTRNRLAGYTLACRAALQRVEGPGAPAVDRDGDSCTQATIDRLFELRAHLPATVGEAMYIASYPLRPDEKKA